MTISPEIYQTAIVILIVLILEMAPRNLIAALFISSFAAMAAWNDLLLSILINFGVITWAVIWFIIRQYRTKE